ncbi:hypothetical protein EW146_g1315 [Bondarzewia mesenterica]|uniref:Uncharacterized protein n=1 Tax=Bondarzewia mesenterica TaxID=1095465 RepID=A0A4V3XG42_9AGAM|nr:hypothetical protein EW146_g1315 [Bondarzewia mesenterica]
MKENNRRRLNTIHDLTTLRLHPDGSRVPSQPYPSTSSSGRPNATNIPAEITTSTVLHTRRSRYTVKDSRGNWIARDAAGLGRVKKRRYVSDEEEPGKGNLHGELEGEAREPRRVPGKMAMKKRRFESELDFLGAGVTSQSTFASDHARGEAGSESRFLPVPSSDLLKCIHHFASAYYASRFQLSDGTREYRLERKAMRLKRLEDASKSQEHDAANEFEEDGGDDNRDEDADTEDEEDSDGGDESTSPKVKGKGRTHKKQLGRDMYKIFDGSALMAIGMLLQEHVFQVLAPDIPPGWEAALLPVTATDSEEEVSAGKEEEYEGRDDNAETDWDENSSNNVTTGIQ